MSRRRIRRLLRVAPLALAALVVAPAALGGVRITGVESSGFPALRVMVLAPRGAAAPRLWENGRPAVAADATNLANEKTIVLAVDRSQSMRGRPIRNAVRAAVGFAAAAGASDHVGVVVFGRSAISLAGPGSQPADAEAALSGLTVDRRAGTALYDAIALAARELVHDSRPGRAIVVVTDGADVSSSHSLDEAVAAARRSHASVYTIGIGGPAFAPDPLRAIARETGGTYRQAATSADLASVYASLQSELERTWQVTYDTAARPGERLRLVATVPGAGRGAADVTLPALDAAPSSASPSPLIPPVGYSWAGSLAVSVLAALLVLAACAFWLAAREGSWLQARLEPHLGAPREARRTSRRASGAAARKRLADTLEAAFANVKQFRALQRLIERADVPWRAGELVGAAVGCAFLLGLFVAVVAASPLFGLVGMAAGFFGPIAYVYLKASARLKRFEHQLPDVLITVAASLKAGHSFRQGIQSVVEEGAEPAAKEFKRVLNETQLGKPMDDALGDMAGRVGSANLSFVITAVTIQRQIGGSLAGLFDMVAETVRQRQQFARKVRSLTAMGRMSAYVLVGLPFFIAAVVSLMNPTYMSPLYHSGTGHGLIIGGLAMMTVGSLFLRKIVSFRG